MAKPIRRAAVIGAGVMAAASPPTSRTPASTCSCSTSCPRAERGGKARPECTQPIRRSGLEKALKARPAAFFYKDRARLVTIGNVEDDLGKVRGCDLIIEAIIEQIESKRALFQKLEALSTRRPWSRPTRAGCRSPK